MLNIVAPRSGLLSQRARRLCTARARRGRERPTFFTAQDRHRPGDLDRRTRRFGAAIDLVTEAALARLTFIVEAQHGIDDWHTLVDCDSLQSVCHRPAQILRMIGFALQNDAACYNSVR